MMDRNYFVGYFARLILKTQTLLSLGLPIAHTMYFYDLNIIIFGILISDRGSDAFILDRRFRFLESVDEMAGQGCRFLLAKVT